MQPPLAVAAALQGGVALLAAVAAAAVLLLADPRRRALAMAAAGVLAALGLASLIEGGLADDLKERAGLLAAGAAGGLAVLAGLGLLLRGRPALFVGLVFATLPFRIPLALGGETANLLVLLYGVIAAGCVAAIVSALRGEAPRAPRPAGDVRVRRLEQALALFVVLYALQALYSTDVERAVKGICFFFVPFALLFRLLIDLEWNRRLITVALGVTVSLAVVAAGVGLVEYATRHLLIFNSKVLLANEIKPYFRVNSLFFDPNIYGRYLAVTMVAIAAALLWRRRGRDVALIAGLLGLLWAGLVVSLSNSSFAALLLGLFVLAALRWRPLPVVAAAVAALAATAAFVLLAPGALGLRTGSFEGIDRATSGRAGLVREGVEMARERPVLGFGAGSFAERYRARKRLLSPRSPAESHTIPVTVAAEQGIVGLIAYLALLAAALALLLDGLRAAVRRGETAFPLPVRLAVAAAWSALLLHTLVYAAFLEDPMTWALLAVAAGLRWVAPGAGGAQPRPDAQAVPA